VPIWQYTDHSSVNSCSNNSISNIHVSLQPLYCLLYLYYFLIISSQNCLLFSSFCQASYVLFPPLFNITGCNASNNIKPRIQNMRIFKIVTTLLPLLQGTWASNAIHSSCHIRVSHTYKSTDEIIFSISFEFFCSNDKGSLSAFLLQQTTNSYTNCEFSSLLSFPKFTNFRAINTHISVNIQFYICKSASQAA